VSINLGLNRVPFPLIIHPGHYFGDRYRRLGHGSKVKAESGNFGVPICIWFSGPLGPVPPAPMSHLMYSANLQMCRIQYQFNLFIVSPVKAQSHPAIA